MCSLVFVLSLENNWGSGSAFNALRRIIIRTIYVVDSEGTMSNCSSLKSRINRGEVILLDGAIGTQLQNMRAPMNNQDRDATTDTAVSPEAYVGNTKNWVEQGAQIIGGCCGFGIEYIRPLREALPEKL